MASRKEFGMEGGVAPRELDGVVEEVEGCSGIAGILKRSSFLEGLGGDVEEGKVLEGRISREGSVFRGDAVEEEAALSSLWTVVSDES